MPFFDELFREKLIDSEFPGVLTPVSEFGQERHGVTKSFLEDAEAYYQRHQGFDYWRGLFATAFDRIGNPDAKIIVEYGCGFGNATLPVLELISGSKILALPYCKYCSV